MDDTKELDFKKEDLAVKQQDLKIKQADLRLKQWALGLQFGAILIGLVMVMIAYLNITHQIQQSNERQEAARAAAEIQRKKEHDQHQKQNADEMSLRKREIEQREKDFKAKYYERQIDVYMELCDICAKLSLAQNFDEKVLDMFDKFNSIALGKLAIVGDSKVFGQVYIILKSYQAHISDKRLDPTKPLPKELMAQAAELALTCRVSLMLAFPSLDPLPEDIYKIIRARTK